MENFLSTIKVNNTLVRELLDKGIITRNDYLNILNETSHKERASILSKSYRPEKLTQFVTVLHKNSVQVPTSIQSTLYPSSSKVSKFTTAIGSEIPVTPSRVSKKLKSFSESSKEAQIPPYKLKLTREHRKANRVNGASSSKGFTGRDSRSFPSDVDPPSNGPSSTIDKKVEALLDKFSIDSQRYPSNYECKGLALLVNIVRFSDPKAFREGADHDTESLFQMLCSFGYDVYDVIDPNKAQLMATLYEFRELFKKRNVDSCIITIMSHGQDDSTIFTSDEKEFNLWTDLIQNFNNANCPSLAGKPKIFLFQYCRGDKTDYGTLRTDSLPSPTDTTVTIPSWTDMLICYSTLGGHYSYRDKDTGSWFIQNLCEVFKRYGKEYDICKCLNLVSEIMKIRAGGGGQKQICPYYNIGFSKDFDFRPVQ